MTGMMTTFSRGNHHQRCLISQVPNQITKGGSSAMGHHKLGYIFMAKGLLLAEGFFILYWLIEKKDITSIVSSLPNGNGGPALKYVYI